MLLLPCIISLFISAITANSSKLYSDLSVCQKEFIRPELVTSHDQPVVRDPPSCYRYFKDYEREYCLKRVLSNGAYAKKLMMVNDTTGDRFHSRGAPLYSFQCYFYDFEIDYSQLSAVFEKLSTLNIDSNITIKSIKITLTNTMIPELKINYTYIGELIDNFLIPRPMWRPLREPFEWQNSYIRRFKNNTSSDDRNLLQTGRHNIIHSHQRSLENNQIIFKRISEIYEPHLRFIANIQYPSSVMCSITPLLIGSRDCGHPGWTSVLHMYFNAHRELKYGIMSTFNPSKKEYPQTQNFFMSEEDCPHKRNLWECAFLRMTNCSLPTSIGITNDANYNQGYSSLYNIAAPDGQRIRFKGENISTGIKDFDRTTENATRVGFPEYVDITQEYVYRMPFHSSLIQQHKPMVGLGEIVKITYIFGFILRQTAFYRSRITELIHNFRMNFKPRLAERTPCAVAHIRRGDRGIYGVNITEYCYNYTHGLKCMDRRGNLGHCNSDTECNGIPFSTVTLQHIASKVPLLLGPDVKDLLLFSDDMDWIKSEIHGLQNNSQSLYKNWNFYYLDVPDPSLTADKVHTGWVRYGKATESGVYLHASLQLAKQCSGFIGHFGSAFTLLFYQSMCHSHHGLEAVCPPVYDMRWGLDYTPSSST